MKNKLNLKCLALPVAGMMMSMSAFAQQITVKGHVQDETGEPIVFAGVAVPGTKTMTQTDANGNFSITVPAGKQLRISYIGYETETLAPQQHLQIVLKDKSKLSEAVVVGYAKVKKEDATGSVTAFKPDEMSKGITTSAQDMLVGKVAGVNVTTTGGTPGAGATIRVRGGSSLNASNAPLIVIDGLAMDNEGVQGLSNGLAMVNPEDIASMTILKDASATAIYGSRASNGVIIITTKKGRKGSKMPQVAYNGYVSMGKARKTYDVMSGDEFREYVTNLYNGAENLPTPLGTANTDWQDQIYQTAVSHDHNLSLTGAAGNVPYRVSVGYTNQNGILKTSNFERFTAAVNLSPTFFNEHLAVNLTAKMMNAKNRYANTGAIGAALTMDPTQPVYFSPENPDYNYTAGYYGHMVNGNFSDPSWNRMIDAQTCANPLAMLELQNKHAKSQAYIGNVELEYKLHGLEDLRLHANVGGDYSQGNEYDHGSPYLSSTYYFGNDWRTTSYKYNLQGNIYAQYVHTFGDHGLDIMAGAEQQHFHRQGFNEGQGTDPFTGAANNPKDRSTTAWATRSSLVSYFGRVNYTLLNRYLATVTMRWDGSSRFADGNRWGTFPSVALAWKMKEEKMFKNIACLSDLKLRLGWGITGQQNIGSDFYYTPLYYYGDNEAMYGFGNNYYNTTRPNAFNPDLTWEKTTTWNAGLDFAFLNGRIDGAVDYYYRHTKDLISTVDVAAGTNFNNQVMKNIGALKNYGFEFIINARPIQTRDFTWQLTYNLGWNKNKITELYGESAMVRTGQNISRNPTDNVQVNAVGYPAASFYVFQQVYDEQGNPIENVFVDRNGDGQITNEDKYIYKKPAADVTMGLTSKILYKDWDFSFTLRSSLNNYVYYDYLSDKMNVSETGIYNHATWENRTSEVTKLGFEGKSLQAFSDFYVRNASFLRCDNITLGYSFRDLFSVGKYKGISGRIYATVQNPFVITGYDGLDPEISGGEGSSNVSGGVDKDFYPRPTTYMLGVSLQF